MGGLICVFPVFPEDKFPLSDDESDDSLVDFKIDPKSENVNKKRVVFQVAEVPFNTLAPFQTCVARSRYGSEPEAKFPKKS